MLTNPELLRETLSSNADNLVRGMHMLTEDIKAGHGSLKITQSDPSLFEVGRNLALTPGKVIFHNLDRGAKAYRDTTTTFEVETEATGDNPPQVVSFTPKG